MGTQSSEPFGQERIGRCVGVFQRLASHWAAVKRFECRVVTDESVQGKTFDQLAKMRFSMGIGEDLTELPLAEMLTVFKMFSDHCARQESGRARRPQHEFTDRYTLKTAFTESEALAILRDIVTGVGIEVRQNRNGGAG